MLLIELTEKAQSDLDAIHEHYVSHLGNGRADAVIADIFDSIEQLKTFRGMGRPSQAPDVRELVLTRYPFIVAYHVAHEIISIVRILHERNERNRDW
ncbi:type II toxin-antitoxin system RelE/ParE family toxin [Pseudomonas sp. 10B1]|uniref:type II toxin-antitoxin system RelE/ParE family toxin n=1 Tax=unclassified Pseudomonas TaxID=196821 RepID=UPI002AB35675|nr:MULTISPECIES: type II toxin-antitoxin system RelE/ParE family toxin [unclassified Pseudomonas]MDY7559742.1 type II toxin-antitoxin system RelE/ParE family toxin [Pseudomonas sp. AB6]MEA9976667.1 type II toxin-antitoxin system RelE/ParE family toxin [Pseudomonas sp. RTS4]MEA9993022.1 type II toxin-antitoxin system RelE/ParE family toxin [Pseudomonas sp. AA4]MEB0085964.1 type II toxin-antitoxin system RelE/ParE family toxin [Pseudomonas sp. RTI1]MEB0125600.1 type II toxin-antitoxin system Rel